MKSLRLLAPCLFLFVSGCATFAHNYNIEMTCRNEAGPEPGAGYQLFGLAGAAVEESQPDWQAWDQRRQACVQRAKPQSVLGSSATQ